MKQQAHLAEMTAGRLAVIFSLLMCHPVTAVRAGRTQSYMSPSTSGRSMAAIERNMTIDKAHELVNHHKSANKTSIALIQRILGEKTHFRRGRKGNPAAGYSGLDGARKMLAEMLLTSTAGLDLEETKCNDYHSSQTKLVEETSQMIAGFNAAASQAYANMLNAQGQMSKLGTDAEKEEESLKVHLSSCASTLADLRGQRKIVEDDISVMETVLGMTECDNRDDSSSSLLLLQCHDKKKSYVTFQNPLLRKHLRRLKSHNAKSLVQHHVQPHDDEQMFLQAGESHNMMRRPGAKRGLNLLAESGFQEPLFDPTLDGASNESMEEPEVPKCNIKKSANCENIRSKFMSIQSGLETKLEELKTFIFGTSASCETARQEFEAEIERLQGRLAEEETNLATATTQKTNAEEAARLKEELKATQTTEHITMMTTCDVNYKNFRTEICGVKKIRTELGKVSGEELIIQDCKVGEWSQEDCSVSCGGGEMKEFRAILLMQHNGGMECPPLSKVTPCKTEVCPVDCVVGDWSEWSQCSAKCGGGVKEKVRPVLTDPAFGGSACGEISKAENCNVGSCNKGCVLNDWGDWSACSKACVTPGANPGHRLRAKSVLEPAIGSGTCAAKEDVARQHTENCNLIACSSLIAEGMTTLQCNTKLDIVVLIEAGYYANQWIFSSFKTAAKAFIKAMNPGTEDDPMVRIAVVLVEGPGSFPRFNACLGPRAAAGTSQEGDQVSDVSAKDCGVTWVHRFDETQDMDAIATKVDGLTSELKTPPFTSGALSEASAEFQYGREDAQSVVVSITDGHPVSNELTQKAAEALDLDGVRLVWFVTYFAGFGQTTNWASRPLEENFVKTTDPMIASPSKSNELISKMCPAVVNGPTNTGFVREGGSLEKANKLLEGGR